MLLTQFPQCLNEGQCWVKLKGTASQVSPLLFAQSKGTLKKAFNGFANFFVLATKVIHKSAKLTSTWTWYFGNYKFSNAEIIAIGYV